MNSIPGDVPQEDFRYRIGHEGNLLRGYRSDPLSQRYDRVKANHSEKMSRLLAPYLPESPQVLEIGPGWGHFARAMAATNARYDAVEPSDFFRERLTRQGFDVSAEAVPPIPRASAQYDLVHASMLIENLPTVGEAAAFVGDAARVLKPGVY